MADVQGNNGDGDGRNQHEKSNKVRGPHVTNESHWISKHRWQDRSGLECQAGERLLESLYPFPL